MKNISLKNNNIELSDILEVVNSLSSGKEEQEKSIEIIKNGSIEVVPESNKVLSKITVNTNVPSKEEQEKSIEITLNGTQTVIPDDGKTLSRVNITTHVEGIGGDVAEERLKWLNRSFTEFNDGELAKVYGGTFACCTSLSSINLPMCSTVEDYAFYSCTSLSSINLPICSNVGNYVFYNCRALTSIDLPACNSISTYAFAFCSSLTSIDLPACNYIGSQAFYNCQSLKSIDLLACNRINTQTFGQCSSLISANLPVCIDIGTYAFAGCISLTSIDLPVCSSIGAYAFSGCKVLTSLTLRLSDVVKMSNINIFQSTPMSISTLTGSFGSIYVPASLVNAYKSATNWITYADRITAITEIQNIEDIIIPLHTTKIFEIPLAGFISIPENITITSNDENKLNISNIQASTNSLTFNATTYDNSGELNAEATVFYNGKTYTKSFKIIIVESPIGDIETLSISINRIKTILIPWYGSEIASNLSIISNDINKLSISNVQANIDNISFDVTSYNVESEIDITITATYNNEIYTKNKKIVVEKIPTYTIENLGTDYIFALNDSGYYESNNKNVNNSFAICKVNIDAPHNCTMYVDCINYAEANWDYGILSNLDTTLALSNSADANYKKSFKSEHSESVQTIQYDIPAGEHFIYIKFIKDTSGHQRNDSLQFKIRFE